ncbi:MAG: methylated-DNA--[Alphaproteobacteria bacterium]|nr:methylated-DNA--[protein]-cysteine S-methyltransferase [Alphaproteobacteria bacterium]
MDFVWHYQSPLGAMTMAGNGTDITGLWFDGQKYFAATVGTECIEKKIPVFERTIQWLDCYFGGQQPDFTPRLLLPSTPFRYSVCKIMLRIPFGQTITYGDIAAKISAQNNLRTMSARAVGNAVGHNPISLIIPCHRVLGANGKLTGYAGGLERKKQLLMLEKILL